DEFSHTTTEGAQWWDEDQFLAQLFPWHPQNDNVGHYKGWGDQALGIGAHYAKGAAIAYAAQRAPSRAGARESPRRRRSGAPQTRTSRPSPSTTPAGSWPVPAARC